MTPHSWPQPPVIYSLIKPRSWPFIWAQTWGRLDSTGFLSLLNTHTHTHFLYPLQLHLLSLSSRWVLLSFTNKITNLTLWKGLTWDCRKLTSIQIEATFSLFFCFVLAFFSSLSKVVEFVLHMSYVCTLERNAVLCSWYSWFQWNKRLDALGILPKFSTFQIIGPHLTALLTNNRQVVFVGQPVCIGLTGSTCDPGPGLKLCAASYHSIPGEWLVYPDSAPFLTPDLFPT